MPTIGDTTKPGFGYHAWGINAKNQEAERLTMPAHGDLTDLGAWIGGWNDTVRAKLCVWDDDLQLLGESAQFDVANEGSGANGQVSRYEAPLLSPVRLAAGAVFYVGFARNPNDKHQVSNSNAAGGTHYEGKSGSTWPNDLGAVGGIDTVDGRIGAYVANYDVVAGAKLYRSGAWVDAAAVQLYRSGAWVDADAVKVFRSGAWVDAE